MNKNKNNYFPKCRGKSCYDSLSNCILCDITQSGTDAGRTRRRRLNKLNKRSHRHSTTSYSFSLKKHSRSHRSCSTHPGGTRNSLRRRSSRGCQQSRRYRFCMCPNRHVLRKRTHLGYNGRVDERVVVMPPVLARNRGP